MRTTGANGLGMFNEVLPALITFGDMASTPEEFEKNFDTMMDKYEHLKDDVKFVKVYNEDDVEKKYPTYKLWIRPAEIIFSE